VKGEYVLTPAENILSKGIAMDNLRNYSRSMPDEKKEGTREAEKFSKCPVRKDKNSAMPNFSFHCGSVHACLPFGVYSSTTGLSSGDICAIEEITEALVLLNPAEATYIPMASYRDT
jgi:hypothetical protein